MVNINEYSIDWSHPLTKNLVAFIVPYKGMLINLVKGDVYDSTANVYIDDDNSIRIVDDKINYGNMPYIAVTDFLSVHTSALYKDSTTDHAVIDIDSQSLVMWADTQSSVLGPAIYCGSVVYGSVGGLTKGLSDYVTWGANIRRDSISDIYIEGVKDVTGNPGTSWPSDKNLTLFGNTPTATGKDSNANYKFLYIAKRKLSDSEVYQLHNKPFQILKKKRTVVNNSLYPALFSLSSLTLVSKNVSFKSDILNPIDKSLTTKVNIYNKTNKLCTLQSDIVNSIDKILNINSDLLNSITKESTILSNIQNLVSNELTLKNNLLNQIQNTLTFSSDMLNTTELSKVLLSNIQNSLSKNLTVKYDLATTTTSTSVSKLLSTEWNSLEVITRTLLSKYDILNSVGISRTLISDIASSISKGLNINADIISSVSSNITINWDSLAVTSKGLSMSWSVNIDGLSLTSTNIIVIPAKSKVVTIPALNKKILIPK